MAKPQLVSTNATPRSPERQALSDVIARRDTLRRDIVAAKSAWEKSLDHRSDAEDRLEKVRAGAEALNLDAYIAAVNADDACGQVHAVSTPGVDIHQLENDVERWTFTQGACQERIKELETAEQYIPVHTRIDDVIKSEADVNSLLAGFEELRAELDQRLSVLTWLQSSRLVRDEYLEAVKSAVASCYVLPRDEDAVSEWRKAVAELENDADKGLPK